MAGGAQVLSFERLLFRATRGNMFLKHSAVGAVSDPITGEKQEKEVFIVFFAGERARTKILKVPITSRQLPNFKLWAPPAGQHGFAHACMAGTRTAVETAPE